LRKLSEGQCRAIVLALAGLQRLGRESDAGGVLDELVPAAGQGALALEARPGALDAEALAAVSDPDATACVTAERELVRALGASCNTPVGAYAQTVDGSRFRISAWVGMPDGSVWIADALEGDPDGLGHEVAQRLLAAGAGELLRRAELALGAV
jgi:hydroxymethylbilane synthase